MAAHSCLRSDIGHRMLVQSQLSEALGADIHPAAEFGRGVLIQHPLGARPFTTWLCLVCIFGLSAIPLYL